MPGKIHYERVAKGLCPRCGGVPETTRQMCNRCCKQNNKQKLDLRVVRKKKGLCRCGAKRDGDLLECKACREAQKKSQKKHWARMVVDNSRKHDKDAKREYNEVDYITVEFVKALQISRHSRCEWCNCPVQTENRRLDDGLTLNRVDNRLAHIKSNCRLCCYECNYMMVEEGKHPEYLKAKREKFGWVVGLPE